MHLFMYVYSEYSVCVCVYYVMLNIIVFVLICAQRAYVGRRLRQCFAESHHLLLLAPVQLLPHEVHDAGQGLVGRLNVLEAEAGAPCDHVDGCAGVLFDRVLNLGTNQSVAITQFPLCTGGAGRATGCILIPTPSPSHPSPP